VDDSRSSILVASSWDVWRIFLEARRTKAQSKYSKRGWPLIMTGATGAGMAAPKLEI